MGVDRTEGTGVYATETGNAHFLVYLHHPVVAADGPDRAGILAGRFFALTAYDGHAHHGVRIGDQDADGALFGIVDAEMFDGARQFAHLAPGAPFRYHGKFFGHKMFVP